MVVVPIWCMMHVKGEATLRHQTMGFVVFDILASLILTFSTFRNISMAPIAPKRKCAPKKKLRCPVPGFKARKSRQCYINAHLRDQYSVDITFQRGGDEQDFVGYSNNSFATG